MGSVTTLECSLVEERRAGHGGGVVGLSGKLVFQGIDCKENVLWCP